VREDFPHLTCASCVELRKHAAQAHSKHAHPLRRVGREQACGWAKSKQAGGQIASMRVGKEQVCGWAKSK
jgi:hypothetical protein